MAYADSAIDYKFSIENIDLAQGQMVVAYYTAGWMEMKIT